LDLFGHKIVLNEILSNLKKRLELKLKKGAVTLAYIDQQETDLCRCIRCFTEENKLSFIELIKLTILCLSLQKGKDEITPKLSFHVARQEDRSGTWVLQSQRHLENDFNWNFIDCPDGTIEIVLIPALDSSGITVDAAFLKHKSDKDFTKE
jgi:hypothetical protein